MRPAHFAGHATDRARTAIHEAGHAVVAVALGKPPHAVDIIYDEGDWHRFMNDHELEHEAAEA